MHLKSLNLWINSLMNLDFLCKLPLSMWYIKKCLLTNSYILASVPKTRNSIRGCYSLPLRVLPLCVCNGGYVLCNAVYQLGSAQVKQEVMLAGSLNSYTTFNQTYNFLTIHCLCKSENQVEYWCWMGKYMDQNCEWVVCSHHIL